MTGKRAILFQLMSCVSGSDQILLENVSTVHGHALKAIRLWTSMLLISVNG
jgi:hypothetical protein